MERADYEADICGRLHEAKLVPFRVVSIEEWTPGLNHCHSNVDTWVKANAGTLAVRGWVTHIDYGDLGVELTAHSVVQGADGQLFDITPLGDERVRPFMRFVRHSGEESLFSIQRHQNLFITCSYSGDTKNET